MGPTLWLLDCKQLLDDHFQNWFIPSNAGPIYVRHPRLARTMPTSGLAPYGVGSSARTMLSSNVQMFSTEFLTILNFESR